MKYVPYYRVSTKKQGKSGLGLEAQEKAVKEHLSRSNGEFLDSFTEVESGKNNDRPELSKAIKKCRLTGAVLIIARLDRLSRNKAFLFSIMDSKIKFVCADMPEANDLTISFMAIMAEYESDLISKRIKGALAARKARGLTNGNPSALTNRDTTQARKVKNKMAKIRNLEMKEIIEELKVENEGISLRGLSAVLNEAGYTTARGKKWQATSVQRVINL